MQRSSSLKNFPKRTRKIPSKYADLVLQESLHLVANNMTYRHIAKSLAIKLVEDYVSNNRIKYPPVYLIKSLFVSKYRDFLFDNAVTIIEKWRKASIIVFDGIDEINTPTEFQYISSFLSPLIMENRLLILISSGGLTEVKYKRNNGMSFGILLSEIKELVIGE